MNILEKYSITPKHLINSVDDLPTIPVNKFSIELAIELYNFAKKHQLEIGNCLSKWVIKLLNFNEQNINQAALIAKILLQFLMIVFFTVNFKFVFLVSADIKFKFVFKSFIIFCCIKVLRSKLTCARAQKDKYYKLYLQANRSNVQLKKKIHSDEIKLTTLQKQSEQDHAELNELKSVNLESTILLTAVAEGTEFGTLPHSFETSLITVITNFFGRHFQD
jgi:hypothetical protein